MAYRSGKQLTQVARPIQFEPNLEGPNEDFSSDRRRHLKAQDLIHANASN